MKIKICGLKRAEDIDAVNLYKPDYIGFVFAGTKRRITFQQAKRLKQLLAADICAVGVFVDEKIDHIVSLVDDHVIDMIQLHGHEDETYIARLKEKTTATIIKAIRIQDETSLDVRYDVDYYLLDHCQAGSGQSFDWKLIRNLDKPLFLAGGISLDNLDQALKQDVWGLDISTGVETQGWKDPQKIAKVIRRIRNER